MRPRIRQGDILALAEMDRVRIGSVMFGLGLPGPSLGVENQVLGVKAEIIEGFPRPFKGTFKAGEEYPGVLGRLVSCSRCGSGSESIPAQIRRM